MIPVSKSVSVMWSETLARRGSNDIGSCIKIFIENIKTFSFYSDNCSRQNRNRFIFYMFVYLSHKCNIKIYHYFLEKGHTQNEGDSPDLVIERASKNIPIYTPSYFCKNNFPHKPF